MKGSESASNRYNFSLVIKWRFVSRVSDQMTALMSGVNEFIPQNLLSIFDANELEVYSVIYIG